MGRSCGRGEARRGRAVGEQRGTAIGDGDRGWLRHALGEGVGSWSAGLALGGNVWKRMRGGGGGGVGAF